jgi:hypothetical protein
VLLGTLASVVLLPLFTGHALLQETPHLPARVPASVVEHPDSVVLLLLTIATLIPLIRMAGVVRRVLTASRKLRAVTSGGSQGHFEGIDFVRVAGSGVTFFTAGFRRPTIYVTAGAESLLTPGQFYAALLHERAHAEQHDVRWLALVTALERALAFVPWSKRTFALLRLLVERRADERALSAGASRSDLFEAIVIASGPAVVGGAALSEIGTLQRLHWLAEPWHERIDETRSAAVLLASLMTPAALAHVLLWIGVFCAICSTHSG